MKRILMLGTGGIIACKRAESDLGPVTISDEILPHVSNSRNYCRIDTIQILSINGTNIQPSHWLVITAATEEYYERYDDFVIAHGTDTMAYTAAAPPYLIRHFQRPIAITGAQEPVDMGDTDTRTNLMDNLFFASCGKAHDVNIVFDDKIIAGIKGKKEHTESYNIFFNINLPSVAVTQEDHIIFYLDGRERDRETAKFLHELDSNVGLLELTPPMDTSPLDHVAEHYNTIIIESFRIGGLPPYEQDDYYRAISRWTDLDRTMVVIIRVANEGSNMSVYEAGRSTKQELGLLEVYDMTLGAVVTKIM